MLEERLPELCGAWRSRACGPGRGGGISIQMMTLPAVTCCTRRREGHTIAEKYNAMYDFTANVSVRVAASPTSRSFTISERTDYLRNALATRPILFRCVPVRPENAPAEGDAARCRALSVLYYGGLQRRGRGVFGAGARGQRAGAEACGVRAGAGHRGPPTQAGRSRHSGIAPASSCRWRNKTLAIQPFFHPALPAPILFWVKSGSEAVERKAVRCIIPSYRKGTETRTERLPGPLR